MVFFKSNDERGQGLVEYALILVLVAIVVIAILRILGPAVGEVFSEVAGALGHTPITSVSAARTGNDHGNDVDVNVTVSSNTSVTITDSQSGQSVTIPCNGSCTATLSGVGDDAGKVTVSADTGGTRSASYHAKL
jgi:pilus assembly protein Flp/PilA